MAGFAKYPNELRDDPVASSVFTWLASAPRIWVQRGTLAPYQVSASLGDLATATARTPKQVRGALRRLIALGYLRRAATSNGARAIYELVRARSEDPASATDAIGYEESPTGRGHGRDPTGTVEGTVEGTVGKLSNSKRDNGLQRVEIVPRARSRARSRATSSEDKTNTNCEREDLRSKTEATGGPTGRDAVRARFHEYMREQEADR